MVAPLPTTDPPRRAVLVAVLAGLLVKEWQMVRELAMLHAWLDSGSGLGAIVVGMRQHGYEVSLTHEKNGWEATFIHHDQIPSWVGICPSCIASARRHGPSVRYLSCTA